MGQRAKERLRYVKYMHVYLMCSHVSEPGSKGVNNPRKMNHDEKKIRQVIE